MSADKSMLHATAAEGQGAGFRAEREGGFALVTPLTPTATLWLERNIGDEATWSGEALVVELRYFADLADAIIAAGFLFERNALPN